MTDNEIIKALSNAGDSVNYYGNIYLWDWERDVPIILKASDVVNLINCQKAEKEALIAGQETLQKYIAEQKAEIELLHSDYTYQLVRRKAKSRAIKEFAERLKSRFLSCEWQTKSTRKTLRMDEVREQMCWVLHEITVEAIDNLVKEMVGDGDG